MKKQKGITLVSLVVTIIVLIILAGVSINLILSDEGMLQQSQQSKYGMFKKQYEEELEVALMEVLRDNKGKYIYGQELISALEIKLKDKYKYTISFVNENIIATREEKYVYEIDKRYTAKEVEELVETTSDFFLFDKQTGTILGVNPKYLNGKTIIDENFYNIVIPKKIDGVDVVAIGDKAFENIINLKSIIIQGSVKEISKYAFSNTQSLENVIMYPGIEKINTYAFLNCNKLKKVIIPETVKEIELNAFCFCNNMNDVTVPVENNIKTIFEYSKANIEKVTLLKPEGQNKLVNNALDGFTKIKEVIIPEGVTEIGESAFKECVLLEKVEIPETVDEIGPYAFYGCNNLKSIEIPSNVKTINEYMLFGTAITEIDIPEGVTKIESQAFAKCNRLEKVTIPETLETIEPNAFYHCSQITELIIPIKFHIQSIFDYSKPNMEKITLIKTEGQNELVDGTLWGFTKIKELTIPNGVIKIGNSVFRDCLALEKIEIPESVTEIGEYAFYNCARLPSIKLPSKLNKISNYMLYRTAITEIIIPKGVTEIGSNSFGDCGRLSKVEMPETIQTISSDAFRNCNLLINIEFKGTSIPGGQPWGANNLKITTAQ